MSGNVSIPGIRPPAKRTKGFSFTVTESEHAEIVTFCKREGYTGAWLARNLILGFIRAGATPQATDAIKKGGR